jgi:hypothetical protein
MIVYCITPIDDWRGWLKPEKLFTDSPRVETLYTKKRWEESWILAQKLALEIGWEGDIREGCGPFVSVLPQPDVDNFLIAWKQDNNGTTFVASPYRLPWLEEDCYGSIEG